jgi:hypothetical protein
MVFLPTVFWDEDLRKALSGRSQNRQIISGTCRMYDDQVWTSLGPIENWSYDLRAMANLVMGSPHPCAMYWGDDYITIYNEAYVLLAGEKHPALMGMSFKQAWQEI